MKVALITDAKRPSLALMRLSAYHKANGDTVVLNERLGTDLSYGSWLWHANGFACDVNGGPGFDPTIRLPAEVEAMRPDYSLYPALDYSIGYTWQYCPRRCEFCVVPRQGNPKTHHSIWTFHDAKFQKICLLNNNTFSDPRWRETFEEIWDAGLIIHDENGYDARLLDEEKAEALHRTRWDGAIHFAWDDVRDETAVMRGLKLAKAMHLRANIYVLMGFNSTLEEDIYRCQKVHDLGFDPFPMVYQRQRAKELCRFARMINARYYRKGGNITDAWAVYRPTRGRK